MTKSIKSVKHIVTESYNYIVHRITDFNDGSKMLQVAHVMDSLTPEMRNSTSFDWIDSPKTSTYWQEEISDEETIQHFIASYTDPTSYKDPTKLSGKSINDFINNRKIRDDKIATDIVSEFGDKTINVSEGFYSWLIETVRRFADDGDDAKLNVIEKMLNK